MILYFSLLTIALCLALLIFNSHINRSIYFLIVYLTTLSLYGILHHLIFFSNSEFKLAIINIHLIPVYYLTGPMLFFYIRSTLKDSYKITFKDYIHFLPFAIGLVAILPYIPMDFSYKIKVAQLFIDNPESIKSIKSNILYPNYINVIFRPILLLAYSIGCIYLIWKYSIKKRNTSPLYQKRWIIKWLTTISFTSVLIGLSYLLMTYSFFTTDNIKRDAFNQLPISIFSGIIYTTIPVAIIFFPRILYGIPRADYKHIIKAKERNKIIEIREEEPFKETAAKILDYLDKEKPYLNTKFTIQHIASYLEIPKHHVYYCLNNIIMEGFIDMRNRYRIEHAKNLLLSDKFSQMTIEGIGLESGYSSKSHFFAVFKEKTGVSPIEYIEKQRSSN